MKKLIGLLALVSISLLGQSQQINPQNSVTGVAGNATATVTITGVTGQRVKIYAIGVVCNTAGSTLTPTVVVSDGANTLLSLASSTDSAKTTPTHFYQFNPGLTASAGGTVVIQANVGGACTGGTTVTIQADQY